MGVKDSRMSCSISKKQSGRYMRTKLCRALYVIRFRNLLEANGNTHKDVGHAALIKASKLPFKNSSMKLPMQYLIEVIRT